MHDFCLFFFIHNFTVVNKLSGKKNYLKTVMLDTVSWLESILISIQKVHVPPDFRYFLESFTDYF